MSVDSRSDHAHRGRPAGGGAHELRAQLLTLLGPTVAAAGFDLEDVLVTPAGKRRLLRVVVDSDDGVSLDGVATVSQQVSAVLDGSDAMGQRPYVLEVTSPGVDRPLSEPRHWRRATGRLVKAQLTAGGEVTGRVLAADETAVVLDVDGQEHRYGRDELGKGRVQVEFRRDSDDPDED